MRALIKKGNIMPERDETKNPSVMQRFVQGVALSYLMGGKNGINPMAFFGYMPFMAQAKMAEAAAARAGAPNDAVLEAVEKLLRSNKELLEHFRAGKAEMIPDAERKPLIEGAEIAVSLSDDDVVKNKKGEVTKHLAVMTHNLDDPAGKGEPNPCFPFLTMETRTAPDGTLQYNTRTPISPELARRIMETATANDAALPLDPDGAERGATYLVRADLRARVVDGRVVGLELDPNTLAPSELPVGDLDRKRGVWPRLRDAIGKRVEAMWGETIFSKLATANRLTAADLVAEQPTGGAPTVENEAAAPPKDRKKSVRDFFERINPVAPVKKEVHAVNGKLDAVREDLYAIKTKLEAGGIVGGAGPGVQSATVEPDREPSKARRGVEPDQRSSNSKARRSVEAWMAAGEAPEIPRVELGVEL